MANVRELRAEFTARLDGLQTGLDQARRGVENLRTTTETAARSMSERFEASGKKMQEVGKKMSTYLTVPLTAAGAATLKYAIDQEKSFAKVSTLLNAGEVDFKKYKESIRKYSTEMGVSFDEYSESVYSAISAGVDQADAVEFTAKAVKLAKGGFTDTASAVDIMTTAINAYGLEASDADMISDQLINTQNLGKTTVNELASSMGAVIPVAKAQNVSFDQLATGYAVLTKNGIATSEAGTYMKGMLGELGKAGSEVDKILREKTGKSFSELQASGMNVGEVLQILQGHAEENGIKMGDMFGSIEAGSAAMVLAGDGGAEFDTILDSMGKTAGATDDAFQKMQETTGAKMEKAWNSMKNSAASFGDVLLPIVAKISEVAALALDKVAKLDDGMKTIAVVFGAVVAALGPLIAGIGTFMQMAAPVIGWASRMGGLMGALKAVFLALAGPVGIAVAVIVGLGTALVAAYKYSDSFRSAVDKIIEKIKAFGDKVKTFVDAIKGLFKDDGQAGRDLLKKLGFSDEMIGFMDTIAANLSAFRGSIKETIGAIRDILKGDTAKGADILYNLGFTDGFITKTIEVARAIKEFGDKVINSLKAVFKFLEGDNAGAVDILARMGFSDDMIVKIVGIVSSIQSALSTAGTAIKNFAITAGGYIKEAFTAIFTFAKGIVTKVVDFFKSDGAQMLQAAKNVFGFIVDVIKNLGIVVGAIFLGIFKTIQFIMPAVLAIVEMVWNNIKGVINGAVNIIMGIIKIFTGLFTGDLSKMWEGVKQLFMGAVEFLWNAIQLTFFGKILSGAKVFFVAFRSGFASLWNAIKSLFQGNTEALVVYLRRGWDEMFNATKNIFTGIRDFISGVLSGLGSIFSGAISLLRGLWQGGIQGFLAITQTVFNTLRTIFTAVFQLLKGDVSGATGAIAGLLEAGWNKAKEITQKVLGALRDFFVGLWSRMKSDTSDAGNSIRDTISKAWSAVVEATKKLLAPIVDAIAGYLASVKQRFTDDFNAVKNVTTTIFTAVSDFLKKIWDGIVKFLTPLIQGIWNMIKSYWSLVADVTSTIFEGISNFFKMIWSVISQIFVNVTTAIFSIIKEIWAKISAATSERFNAIRDFFSVIWSAISKVFSAALKLVWDYVTERWTAVSTLTKSVFSAIRDFFAEIWNRIYTVFRDALIKVFTYLSERWTAISDFTKKTFNAIRDFCLDIWNRIYTVFRDALIKVFTYLSERWTAISDFTKKTFNAIRDFFTEIWSTIKRNITTAVDNIRDGMSKTWSTALSNTKTAFTDIFNAIRDRFNNIVDAAKALPGRISDGLRAMASKVKSGVNSVVNTMGSALERGVNGVIGGINTVLGALGVSTRVKTISVPRYQFGTEGKHPGGYAVVGDGVADNAGEELIETPDGRSFLSPAKPTVMDLPKGTKVYSAKETRKILDYGHGELPHYAFGDALRSAADWVKGKVKSAGSALLGMLGSPSKMLESAMNVIAPKGDGLIGGMALGGFNKAKSAGVEFVKKKIADYLAALASAGGGKNVTSGSGGVWPSPFRLNSAPGMRLHPIDRVLRMHNGWDWGAPIGTPIPAQAAGTVSQSGYHSIRGNYVRIRSTDGYDRIYQHNSRNAVRSGAQVNKGQTVGYVGSTGSSTGPHLHYEVLKYAEGGIATNPQLAMLAEGGWAESIISHDPAKRVSQRSIWNETGQLLGFKGENELSLNRDIIAVLERIAEGVETEKDRAVLMNDRVVGQLISRHVREADNLNSRRKNTFGGEY